MRRGRRKGNRRLAGAEPEVESRDGESAGAPPRSKTFVFLLIHGAFVVVAAGIVAGFTFGGRALARWLRTSESFALTEVQVEGREKLLEEEVLAQAGIEPGMSIFELDELEASRALEFHPWVREATVEKQMPDRVTVEVVERELAALVWLGELWRMDVDGAIFERHPDDQPVDQVIITGIDESWREGDERQLRRELCKLVQIIEEYERMGLGRLAPVKNVHREHGGGVVLYVGDDAREIRLGEGHTRKKLKRLRAVLRELDHEGLSWDYIMVDSRNFPERVVVKLGAA
jgi:cell division protein FtsQ